MFGFGVVARGTLHVLGAADVVIMLLLSGLRVCTVLCGVGRATLGQAHLLVQHVACVQPIRIRGLPGSPSCWCNPFRVCSQSGHGDAFLRLGLCPTRVRTEYNQQVSQVCRGSQVHQFWVHCAWSVRTLVQGFCRRWYGRECYHITCSAPTGNTRKCDRCFTNGTLQVESDSSVAVRNRLHSQGIGWE